MSNNDIVGTVVDNNDPKKMGRIRVRVPNVHDNVPDNQLPWAVNPNTSSGNGAVNVPKIGSQVFYSIDDSTPKYYGNVVNASALPDKLAEGYPARKGFVTESGVSFFVDTQSGLVELDNGAGAVLTILPSGDISVSGEAKLNFEVGSNITITGADIKITGDVELVDNLVVKGDVEIEGDLKVTGSTDLKTTKINDITQSGS